MLLLLLPPLLLAWLLPSSSSAAVLVVTGTTVPPGFDRTEGKSEREGGREGNLPFFFTVEVHHYVVHRIFQIVQYLIMTFFSTS